MQQQFFTLILNIDYKDLLKKILLVNIKTKLGKQFLEQYQELINKKYTYIEIGEVKGVLQRKSRIKGESFKVGDTLKAVVKGVNIDKSNGLLVDLSRTSQNS